MGIERAEVIARMRVAFKEGVSATRFIGDMRVAGLSYRRTDMLADWRIVTGQEAKKGLLRFVRKDLYPSSKIMAGLSPDASKEFMYKIKVQSILKPGEPITERFVNIMSDEPMTPEMMASEVESRWAEPWQYLAEELVGLQVWSAYGKGME